MSADYHHTRKISRLPPLPETLDPILEERFSAVIKRGGQILNLHLAQGHAPNLSRSRGEFVWILRNECQLSRRLLELTILRTAMLLDCAYELDHHLPLARRAGVTDAQIDALPDWRSKPALFSGQEQALLDFVEELSNRGNVSDATYARLNQHFSAREIVEIATCATSYYANALFVKSLRIEIDAPHVKAAPGKI